MMQKLRTHIKLLLPCSPTIGFLLILMFVLIHIYNVEHYVTYCITLCALFVHLTFPYFLIGQHSSTAYIMVGTSTWRKLEFSLACVVKAFFFTKNKSKFIGYTANYGAFLGSKCKRVNSPKFEFT